MRWLLVLLIIVGIAIGSSIYFEWVTFATVKTADGAQTLVTMTIHHDTIQRDIDRIRGKGINAAQGADAVKKETPGKGKTETVRGILRTVNTDEITLNVAGKNMVVKLLPSSRILIDGREGKATELKIGQEVLCTQERREGNLVCHELTVGEKAK